jgi:pimeloyl-ACP methyl ester carboxylesterase
MVHTPRTGLLGTIRRHLRHLAKTSQAVIVLVSCLHAKAHVQGEITPKKIHSQNLRGLSIPNPKSKAVVLFLHGSLIEKMDDTCDPEGETAGFSAPTVVKELAGMHVSGLEVIVFAPCHGRATLMGEPLKIDQRVAAIKQTLQELSSAGVDPSRIFLIGQSAGGWAALLHQKRYPGSANAVVAFAPAFAGKKRWRPDIWQQRHDTQSAEIMSAKHIAALVFAFDNDVYNSPEDLAFLSQIKGTTLLRMPEKSIDGIECEIPLFASSHGQAYRKCFGNTQSKVLLNFIRHHLPPETAIVADTHKTKPD